MNYLYIILTIVLALTITGCSKNKQIDKQITEVGMIPTEITFNNTIYKVVPAALDVAKIGDEIGITTDIYKFHVHSIKDRDPSKEISILFNEKDSTYFDATIKKQ